MPEETSCAYGAADSVDSASIESASAALVAFLDRLLDLGRPETMESLAATDITFSQLRVLCALGSHDGPMPVNAIAEQVQLSLAAAGRTVDKLVCIGFADRREDSADRRIKRVSLTGDGVRYLETHLALQHDTVRQFVAGLPAELRDNLCSALRPIVDDAVDHFCLTAPTRQEAS
ncbi:MarR family winged helix-turn-helix transcriptional regulator [Gordonia amicalis]|uniref:MarR family winged helix-turn-helix transcriptional regulator n=1 Tax=Gordonia amicalis TaxID=89053 RepID=UPI0029539AAC|nr:MarR family transcriptional regulator [Gordonia amicalis]MDV7099587.1 MarR family transcriptional regulator [Gordonia amicalis]